MKRELMWAGKTLKLTRVELTDEGRIFELRDGLKVLGLFSTIQEANRALTEYMRAKHESKRTI